MSTENNAAKVVPTMEVVHEVGANPTIKAKGDIASLPKVKKAIIGRADINSYGTTKNGHKGEMVGSRFEIRVILAENYKTSIGEIKAGERTTANAVLFAAGVKTLPFFTDFEKAKEACKKVAKWGREAPAKQKKIKAPTKAELEKTIADLQAQLALALAK